MIAVLIRRDRYNLNRGHFQMTQRQMAVESEENSDIIKKNINF
jgi:hypothetical protein